MDDPALHRRLDGIERRQRVTILLLVVPYLLGGGAFLLGSFGGASLAVLVLGLIAFALALLLVGLFTAGHRSSR